MKNLKEEVERLKEGFEKGEQDPAVFTRTYTESRSMVQLIYSETSEQFVALDEAIQTFLRVGSSFQSRLELKSVCLGIFQVLVFA